LIQTNNNAGADITINQKSEIALDESIAADSNG